MITKEQVSEALNTVTKSIQDEGGEKVAKGSGSVPQDSDLNSGNGAAQDGDNDLKAPGDSMNEKYGNKRGKVAKEGDKGMKKSLPPEFQSELPSEVKAKVEVSTFLKSLVDHVGDNVDGLRDFVAKSDEASETRHEEINDRIDGLYKSMGHIGVVLKSLCEHVGIISQQPAHEPKSQGAAPAQHAVQKSYAERPSVDPAAQMEAAQPQAEQSGGAIYKSLSGKSPAEVRKSISAAMCELVRKGDLAETDVINFETFGHVSAEAHARLAGMLN
jgi:hypothetical protein